MHLTTVVQSVVILGVQTAMYVYKKVFIKLGLFIYLFTLDQAVKQNFYVYDFVLKLFLHIMTSP